MRNVKDYLDRLKSDHIIKYINHLGWHKIANIPNVGTQYASDNEEYVVNIITNKDLIDYDQAVLTSLSILSQFTSESIETIILKLLYPAFDRIKWRVVGVEMLDGTIPFSILPDLLKSIKETFTVAINDIENPQVYHTKLKTKESSKLFNDLQFGQTEIGSYIINILSPLGGYQWDLFGGQTEIPIGRQVTEKLIQSVHEIETDLDSNNRSKIEEELEQQKYSVNFLQSILSVQTSTKDASIDIIADWCVNLPPTEGIPSVAKIKRAHMDVVGQIVEKYRKVPDEIVEHSFVGKISAIESEPEIGNRKYVRVKLATIGSGGKAMNIYSNLDYIDYFEEVSRAFSEGLNVRIKGLYEDRARGKEILDAEFNIII